ncbi:MAG: hypothetical protein M1821_008289 [Bathelium mastoideum]|nr:MAG: hypothetical protein M1821_008289 [Bathelium mastoideum]
MLHAHIKYGPGAAGKGQYENAFESPTFEREVMVKINEPVGSATISPCGRDIALASNEGLHIVDLDNIYSPPRLVKHFTTGDVADVQWSPFASRDSWLISTTNQKALVWNLNMRQSPAPIEYVLHGHSRAITDINFSAHHPDLLATCSVDSSIACWDLRDAGKPHMRFSQFQAGATQVKWNRQDCNILASAHHSKLVIWDCRRGNEPLCSIDAHDTKIYGIDWHRTRTSAILTCSLDRTIKLWDYAVASPNTEHLERVIYTPFPVWRARHTPFGWGILAMPQRDSNDLFMYDRRLEEGQKRSANVEPVCNFPGHGDSVKEFLWRSRGEVGDDGVDDREFQLVSWGRDRLLKLHRIKRENLESVGYEKGKAVLRKYNLTRKGATYRTFTEFSTSEDDFSTSGSLHPVTIGGHRESALTNLIKGEGQRKTTHAPIIPYPQGFGSGMTYIGPAKVKPRKEENVISWMKNVSLGPREWESTEVNQEMLNGDEPIHSTKKLGDPEDLGDEITQVGDQFKRITFEEANVSNILRRYAIISLYGPWGDNAEICPMRITINFPRQYPKMVPPRFSIDETSNIKKETAKRLVRDLDDISEVHAQQSNGCLEDIMMYLLGERSKDDCTNQPDLHSRLPSADGDSSSDEGDESGIIGGLHDMEASGTDIMPKTNVNVPMATTCTVKWSNDGQLVCVFMVSHETVEEQSSRFSEIVHKYARSSIGRMNRAYGLGRASSSSSDSSSSDDPEVTSSEPLAGWLNGKARLHPSRSAESSQLASGGIHRLRPQERTEKESRIRRVDMRSSLPPLRALAEQYTILGRGEEVCQHNAVAAAALGYRDHVDGWSLLAIILEDCVPLKSIRPPTNSCAFDEDVLVVAERTLVQIKRKDGSDLPDGDFDLSFDEPEAVVRPKFASRVKWGSHPFGGAWLIPRLFDYFEAQSDLLMLGMMATVLAQPENTANAVQSFAAAAPGYSLCYAPSAEASPGFPMITEAPLSAGALRGQRPEIHYDALANLAKLVAQSQGPSEFGGPLPTPPASAGREESANTNTHRPQMNIEFMNQDRFEDEGHYDAPLLSSPELVERCHIYRLNCAYLLRSLGQWHLAAEMEKISHLRLKGQRDSNEGYGSIQAKSKALWILPREDYAGSVCDVYDMWRSNA